jgi:peroxiredoxin
MSEAMPKLGSWQAVALVLAVALFADSGLAQGPATGFLAPDFTLPDVKGKAVRLADFRGKKAVLLNFWATWCPSCQKEMPTMEALYQRFKAGGLEIVAVSIDRDRQDVAMFMEAYGLTFPALLDADSRIANTYRVSGIPTHYFIDRAGVIQSREVGPKDWSQPETWKAIEALLR